MVYFFPFQHDHQELSKECRLLVRLGMRHIPLPELELTIQYIGHLFGTQWGERQNHHCMSRGWFGILLGATSTRDKLDASRSTGFS